MSVSATSWAGRHGGSFGVAPCGLLLASLVAPIQAADDSILIRAESLLVRGDLEPAREILDSHLREHDEDARALILLGRVHLEWPVIGRFKAYELFQRAGRLVPHDPEPHYWAMQVGLAIGGADGEAMARRSLFRVWQRMPAYRDTWETWRHLYRGEDHRREAVTVFERHAGNVGADRRRAELWMELERYELADSLVAVLIDRSGDGGDDGGLWALRAQSALEAHDTSRGLEFYEAAIDRAALDTAGVLWQQVATIASPAEDSAYAGTPPRGRAAFLRAFWDRREPDFTTAINERIVEHFERLRYARREYHLQQPMRAVHRRRTARDRPAFDAFDGLRSPDGRKQPARFIDRVRAVVANLGIKVGTTAEHQAIRAGRAPLVPGLDEPDSVTRYARFGLDGRGLYYMRYGQPSASYYEWSFAGAAVEIWRYDLVAGSMVVTFVRAGGDMIVTPITKSHRHNLTVMLETDSSTVRAELPMTAWLASFRGPAWNEQVVLLGTVPRIATAGRWHRGGWIERQTGSAPFRFTVPAGPHHFRADARHDGQLGRVPRTIDVPWYWGDRLSVSSILVGTVADTAFGRDDLAAAMPGDLRFPIGRPLALYAEIYNLPADATGYATYELIYAFEPEDGDRSVTFSFVRRHRAAPVLVERLVVEPGEVPRGRYRIRITVRDRVFGREVEQTRVDVELR